MECLEVDSAVGAGPAWACGVVGFEFEVGEVGAGKLVGGGRGGATGGRGGLCAGVRFEEGLAVGCSQD